MEVSWTKLHAKKNQPSFKSEILFSASVSGVHLQEK